MEVAIKALQTRVNDSSDTSFAIMLHSWLQSMLRRRLRLLIDDDPLLIDDDPI